MDAREIIETKEVKWIIERSTPQVDDFDWSEIPGSAHFVGNLPTGMVQALKKMFKAAGANVADCGKTTVYSIASGETEEDFSVSVTLGATKSTQNRVKFGLSPFTW